ncbi:hypothetical protein Sjap_001043 [Stephania japonica]|uniref:non-specific serine/threonine protein kinase n=1 Tax=Stephania japonica TaxID=461633 RepID=A0AAP0PR34_9MAGN
MIYNMSSIEVLDMAENNLHGNLPQDMGHTLPNLTELYLGGNKFSGTIPKSLANASWLRNLELSSNNFVGRVPKSLGSLQNLNRINLESNHLGSGKEGDLDFITSLTNCKNLQLLALDNNLLGGVLPNSISNLSANLSQFFLGRNQIHGNILPSIGNLTKLIELALEENLFTGSIPSSLGKLQNMQLLSLYKNRLTGNIPPSLGNISLLGVLDLSNNYLEGNIPTTLSQCKFLQRLYLYKNNLSGTIPKQVLTGPFSQSIIDLDVSMNSLTGPLPPEVGNLKNLFHLDVSHNKLIGEIPSTLGTCASLKYLHLEANSLMGEIPMTLNALKDLSDLDLSKNNLSGPIPKYLENLPLLKLNLSSNNLEGEVPKEGAFKNASAVFVGGNTKLCGGIVELHLPRCTEKPSIKRGRSLNHKKIIGLIISVVGCLLLFFFVLMYRRMRKTKKRSSTPSMDKFDRIKLSYEDLFKATNGFSATNLIGSGSFGSVYKGVLNRDEAMVAVKVLNLQQRGASKTFKAEYSKGNDFKALVFELMPNGNLEQWLHPRHNNEHNQQRKLSFVQRLSILIDVASALDYLHHHCHTMIVHCDLKPSNILLDADMTAHVGDFGLARLFPPTHQNFSSTQSSSIGMKGSIGYSAPEYGIGGEASTQGDVYSFGILMLEMITGRRPTDGMFGDDLNLHMFAKMAMISESVVQILDAELLIAEETMIAEDGPSRNETSNRRGEKMRECAMRLMKIGVECSKEASRERMDMRDVTKELNSIRNHLHDDVRTIAVASTSN